MSIATAPVPATQKKPITPDNPKRPPRLWPGIMLVVAYWIAWTIANTLYAATFEQFLTTFWAPQVLLPAILIWLLSFSRLAWRDRLWVVACLVLAGIAATALAHRSMLMGMLMYATPVAVTAIVLTLAATSNAARNVRWSAVALAALLAWGYYTLIRVDGISAALQAERSWRWSPRAEDKLIAERKQQTQESDSKADVAPLVATAADWPAFRGPQRDGHLVNATLQPDWTAHPPKKLWQRRVGPGWSSFAVVGNHVFTQEQRGDVEAVVCFNLLDGKVIWSHEDKVRFDETVGGAGPRATPTFDNGKIYAMGGSGVLNCLDAATGKTIWSHDIAAEWGTKPPQWGFSSSPLVAQGIVTVFSADGKEGHGVVAYDAETGEQRWAAGKAWHSYSSPHLFKAGGEEEILMVSEQGIEAFEPTTGKVLWEHDWNLKDMFRVCQPHILGDSKILIGTWMGGGTRLVEVAKDNEKWTATEKWTSKDLKPYFNDFVSWNGYLYGLDGDILVCIDAETGKKKWKKGRYGYGQVLLIGTEGLLLIVSDKGEIVLTQVSPDGFTERGKVQAISGKTWNHPVIAGGKLLVRNGEEMACFELAPPPALAVNH